MIPARFKVVVPARYASTRLPAKPLLDLGGKPMVVRVAERAALSGAEEVWVATDHAEVLATVERHGLPVVLTREDHPSGTDRLAEVVEQRGWDDETIIVNVQGDEPLIAPELIALVASRLANTDVDIVTVAHPILEAADFFNPNIVKVVCKANGEAMYFSRAPIPYARDHFAQGRGAEHPSGRDGGLPGILVYMPTVPDSCESIHSCRRRLWRALKRWSSLRCDVERIPHRRSHFRSSACARR